MPDYIERGSQGEGVEKSEHLQKLESEARERGLDDNLINRLSHFFEVRESKNIHIVDHKTFAEGHALLVEHLPTQRYPYFDPISTKRIETMIMLPDDSEISDQHFGKTQTMHEDIRPAFGDYSEKIEDIEVGRESERGGIYQVSASPLRNPLYYPNDNYVKYEPRIKTHFTVAVRRSMKGNKLGAPDESVQKRGFSFEPKQGISFSTTGPTGPFRTPEQSGEER